MKKPTLTVDKDRNENINEALSGLFDNLLHIIAEAEPTMNDQSRMVTAYAAVVRKAMGEALGRLAARDPSSTAASRLMNIYSATGVELGTVIALLPPQLRLAMQLALASSLAEASEGRRP